MSYSYKILKHVDAKAEIRGILGVTAVELTDDELDLLPLMPAADSSVAKRCPNYVTLLADTDKAMDLKLGALYIAAANALPTLRFKLLQVETDNKTTAQRFKNALDLTVSDLMAKAESFLNGLESYPSLESIFITVAPDVDVITGE